MRILFSSAPESGHVNPLLPVARALADLGHDIRFLTPGVLPGVREAGFRVEEAPGPDPVRMRKLAGLLRSDPVNGPKTFMPEFFGRLCTEAMLPAATALFERWRPDLVLHEPSEFGAAIAAEPAGIAHAVVAITTAESLQAMVYAVLKPVLDDVAPGEFEAVAAAPYLTRLPEVIDPSPFERTLRYRDPAAVQSAVASAGLDAEQAAAFAELTAGGSTRFVYATLGSEVGRMAWGADAYRLLLDVFTLLYDTDPDIRILLTTGRDVDPAGLGAVPTNTRVLRWFPQEVAFGAADMVVSHGGSGSAYGALGMGLPAVILPLFGDQPLNARLLSNSGAAIQIGTEELREGRLRANAEAEAQAKAEAGAGASSVTIRLPALAAEIAESVHAVLDKPQYADKAREIGAQFAALPSLEEVFAAWVR
jgi:UDP:flavonoid glycosyltransferase YjiC (YdhE family)